MRTHPWVVVLLALTAASAPAQEFHPLQPMSPERVFSGKLQDEEQQWLHFVARPAERIVFTVSVKGPPGTLSSGLYLAERRPMTYVDTIMVEPLLDPDPKDSEWTVEVRTRLFAGGDYYLKLEASAPVEFEVRMQGGVKSGKTRARSLARGGTARGTISDADALNAEGGFGEWVEVHVFEGTAKQKVTFDLRGQVHPALVGPDGENVKTTPDDKKRHAVELPATGKYRLEIHGRQSPAIYSVGFDVPAPPLEPPPDLGTPPQLYPGQKVKGLFDDVGAGASAASSPTVFRRYLLDGRKGQKVTLTLKAEDAAAHLVIRQVMAAPQVLVGADHDEGGGGAAQLEATLPRDGSYAVDLIGDRAAGKREAPYQFELGVKE